MMRHWVFGCLLCCCLPLPLSLCAQLREDFTDGELGSNPAWIGETDEFAVAGARLQAALTANGTASIVTAFARNLGLAPTEWRVQVRCLQPAPDANNRLRVYLVSNSANIEGSLNGYFLEFGQDGASDAVQLYQQVGAARVLMISGPAGQVAQGAVLGVRVRRAADGSWFLAVDPLGGTNYQPAGETFSAAFLLMSYFGIQVRASTAEGRNGWALDDMYVGDWETVLDMQPPRLVAVNVPAGDSIQLAFDERLSAARLEAARYAIAGYPGIVVPISADVEADQVLLRLAPPLDPNRNYLLTLSGLADGAGNVMPDTTVTVRWNVVVPPAAVAPGELVVNEVMWDPPTGGARYVELRSRSDRPLDLAGLRLQRVEGVASSSFDFVDVPAGVLLPPGGYVALTSDSTWVRGWYRPPDSARIRNLPRRLPAIDASGGLYRLLRPDGVELDQLAFRADWHHPDLRDRNGAALERVSPTVPSQTGSNWHTAATAVQYGTPGYANSQGYEGGGRTGIWLVEAQFSPNGDGYRDALRVAFRMAAPGLKARLRVYDTGGRLLHDLLPAGLLPADAGELAWDGRDRNGQLPPAGVYFVLAEVLDARAGGARTYRLPFVLSAP